MSVPDANAPLHQTIVGYPADHPIQDAVELAGATKGDLGDPADPVVEATWRQLRAVVRAYTRDAKPLLTASEVYQALLDKQLLPDYQQLWTVFVLDSTMCPRFTRLPGGSVGPKKQSYAFVPAADKLPRTEPGDRYLLVARATPRVMSDHPEIATKIAALRASANVTDVVFWHRVGPTPSMWTLKGGLGVCGDRMLEFPDENRLKEASK
jgi:hypothetical protein